MEDMNRLAAALRDERQVLDVRRAGMKQRRAELVRLAWENGVTLASLTRALRVSRTIVYLVARKAGLDFSDTPVPAPSAAATQRVLLAAYHLRRQTSALLEDRQDMYLQEEVFVVDGRELGLQRQELAQLLGLRAGQMYTIMKRMSDVDIKPKFTVGRRPFIIPDHQIEEFARRHGNGESFFSLSFGTPYTPDRIRRQMIREGYETRNPLKPTVGQHSKGEEQADGDSDYGTHERASRVPGAQDNEQTPA